MTKDIRLSDGSILEIKVNFFTVKLMEEMKLEAMSKKLKKEPNNKKLQLDMASKLIYAIIRSNGRKVDMEEAMILVPADDKVLAEIFTDFAKKMEKIKKKKDLK